MSSRVCRKCRNRFELETLVKKGNHWFCKEDCSWQPRTEAKQTSEPKETAFTSDRRESQQYYGSSEATRGVVITAAQNNTAVNKPFFKALQYYCEQNFYDLLVLPITYRVKGNEEDLRDEWYDPLVISYLVFETQEFNDWLIIADSYINATAIDPLSGMEALTCGQSGVFPHPTYRLKCVPTSIDQEAIILTTTGACTLPKYSKSKAGSKARFHHVHGAIVLDNNSNKPRHLNAASDGSFIDYGIEYSSDRTKTRAKTLGIITGDWHVGYTCPNVREWTIRLVEELLPEKLFFHDFFDGGSINHHEAGNPFANPPFSSLISELEACIKELKFFESIANEVVLVDSNHHHFLLTWLKNTDWRRIDRETGKLYLELARTAMDGIDPLYKYFKDRGCQFSETYSKEDYSLVGVRLNNHGHKGANGARGSIKQFARTASKSSVGHAHTPEVFQGVHQVGTSTRMLCGYNEQGLSSWANAHDLLYENGKRQLLFMP